MKLLALLVTLLLPLAAQAQDLVVGGETISDAKTVAAARAEGKLTLYATYPPEPMSGILAVFKADTGITLEYLRLTSQIMFPRVTSEFAAHRLAADYVDMSDPTLTRQLVEAGILNAPHKVPAFGILPPELRDPEGRWYTLIRSVGIIGANSEVVSAADLPTRWTDLLNPKWSGVIGMPAIETGGSAFVPMAFLKQKVAPDFWARLAKQKPHIYPSAAPNDQDLIRGETSLAISTTSLVTQARVGAPVKMIFPTEGVPAFPISGGITATAPHPNAAALFLDWMTSRRAAAAIGESGSYGINPEAPPPRPEGIQFPPASSVWNMAPAQYESIRASYIEEWHKTFGK